MNHNTNELCKTSSSKPFTDEVYRITHDLMNQLCVIDLCIFQMRSSTSPLDVTPPPPQLAVLERTVSNAMQAARRLSQQINRPTENRTSEQRLAISRTSIRKSSRER